MACSSPPFAARDIRIVVQLVAGKAGSFGIKRYGRHIVSSSKTCRNMNIMYSVPCSDTVDAIIVVNKLIQYVYI